MAKINLHIEIVSSTTPGLSSMGKMSRNAAQHLLSKHYEHVGISIINDLSDLEALVAKSPDLVLLGMKFIPQKEGLGITDKNIIWLADYLEERHIATTGSPSFAHKLEISKPLTKKTVQIAGYHTARYFVARMNRSLTPDQAPGEYPFFVKPANRGGGLGIGSDSVVYNFSELKSKIDSIAATLGSDSLIETYLPGREFSVAILKGDNSDGYSVMPIELVAPRDSNGARILGSSVKRSNAEEVFPVLHNIESQLVVALALNAFRSIGGRDYGRIDIRMDEHGTPYILEANLIPSLIDEYGSFPKACALNLGMDYEEMLLRIITLGMTRARLREHTPRLVQSLSPVYS